MVVGPDGRVELPWLEQPLRQALAQQRSHAVLVQASDGIGALQFMLALAQAWLCEGGVERRPCGRCEACRLVQAHAHPDLQLLLSEALRAELGWAASGSEGGDGGKAGRKPSRQIRIDEVRAAIDWIVQSSSRGGAKVAVLYPAEAMNVQAASALLKTLEEPPGQARLLLGAADPDRLLPTVRSRCHLLRLAGPSREQAAAWLAAQGVADAGALLTAAAGRPLHAQALAAAGIDARRWQALPGAVARGQPAAVAGWPLSQVLDALNKLCHDAMRVAAGGAPVYFPAAAIPAGAGLGRLSAWALTLRRVARHEAHPWNEALLIDSLLCEGRACWQDATTGEVSARRPLDTLQR